MSLTGRRTILQIHPTRRCNLTCLHCYSDSGPRARGDLDLPVLRNVVDDAVVLGYDSLAVSGGEPLMYRHICELVDHAHGVGMRTAVTTNGTLNSEARLAPLAPTLDLLAISLDGPAEDHDTMRNRDGAFAALHAGLEVVRACGIPFGFLMTLTQHNVHQLDWAAHFAVEQGASVLQVHPLEPTGRGAALADQTPDEIEASFAALEVARLHATLGDTINIQLDLAVRGSLAAAAAANAFDPDDNRSFAQQVSPLVIEPDGACVPLEYGFTRTFEICNITTERLGPAAARWSLTTLEAFRHVCGQAYSSLSSSDTAPEIAYPYSSVRAHAEQV